MVFLLVMRSRAMGIIVSDTIDGTEFVQVSLADLTSIQPRMSEGDQASLHLVR